VKTDKKGKWDEVACNSAKNYACQIAPDTTPAVVPICGSGWIKSGDLCYILNSEAVNYTIAQAGCSAYGSGAVLAAPTTQAIQTVLNTLNTKQQGDFWIGLDDQTAEDTFKFSDNTTFTKSSGDFGSSAITWSASFTSWKDNQPAAASATREIQDCVKTDKDGKWDDVARKTPRNFTCQMPTGATPAAVPSCEGK